MTGDVVWKECSYSNISPLGLSSKHGSRTRSHRAHNLDKTIDSSALGSSPQLPKTMRREARKRQTLSTDADPEKPPGQIIAGMEDFLADVDRPVIEPCPIDWSSDEDEMLIAASEKGEKMTVNPAPEEKKTENDLSQDEKLSLDSAYRLLTRESSTSVKTDTLPDSQVPLDNSIIVSKGEITDEDDAILLKTSEQVEVDSANGSSDEELDKLLMAIDVDKVSQEAENLSGKLMVEPEKQDHKDNWSDDEVEKLLMTVDVEEVSQGECKSIEKEGTEVNAGRYQKEKKKSEDSDSDDQLLLDVLTQVEEGQKEEKICDSDFSDDDDSILLQALSQVEDQPSPLGLSSSSTPANPKRCKRQCFRLSPEPMQKDDLSDSTVPDDLLCQAEEAFKEEEARRQDTNLMTRTPSGTGGRHQPSTSDQRAQCPHRPGTSQYR